jgi:hypothetical protein
MFHPNCLNIRKTNKKRVRRKVYVYCDTCRDSYPLPSGRDWLTETMAQKDIIEELKLHWKNLWSQRIDDKVRAEGIADRDFSMLFVEKGTVIFATRDFKILSLREIVALHHIADVDRVIPPSPRVGGWGKFIKTAIVGQKRPGRVKRVMPDFGKEKQRQQLKKGGRGWLHA